MSVFIKLTEQILCMWNGVRLLVTENSFLIYMSFQWAIEDIWGWPLCQGIPIAGHPSPPPPLSGTPFNGSDIYIHTSNTHFLNFPGEPTSLSGSTLGSTQWSPRNKIRVLQARRKGDRYWGTSNDICATGRELKQVPYETPHLPGGKGGGMNTHRKVWGGDGGPWGGGESSVSPAPEPCLVRNCLHRRPPVDLGLPNKPRKGMFLKIFYFIFIN